MKTPTVLKILSVSRVRIVLILAFKLCTGKFRVYDCGNQCLISFLVYRSNGNVLLWIYYKLLVKMRSLEVFRYGEYCRILMFDIAHFVGVTLCNTRAQMQKRRSFFFFLVFIVLMRCKYKEKQHGTCTMDIKE